MADSEVRPSDEVRLVTMTRTQLGWIRVAVMAFVADDRLEGAEALDAFNDSYERGITEEEAEATRVAVASPYNAGQRKLAQSLAAKLRSAFSQHTETTRG
jgi:hypothetical protein